MIRAVRRRWARVLFRVAVRIQLRKDKRPLPPGLQYAGGDSNRAASRRLTQAIQKNAKDINRLRLECAELQRQAVEAKWKGRVTGRP